MRRDKRAVSPAISSIIMIAAVLVMILVAMSYASTILDARLAENEFSANKQFMLTTGLQIDDVAWTVGRTQTITYSSRFGHVKIQPLALDYTVEVHYDDGRPNETIISSIPTGMIMYNMPISDYNLGNNYLERLSPRNNASFLQQGPTAPVSHEFIVERLPMNDGNFIRIVAVPSIRSFGSSIVGPSQSTSTVYCKFFLPILEASNANPALSQSITMVGNYVNKTIRRNVDQVRISVGFPNAGIGLNSTFFGFEKNVETQVLPAGSVVEFYVSKVVVSVGQV